MAFRLSSVLSGHSADVRCLSGDLCDPDHGPSQFLVSGSRDQTARLWRTTPESKDLEWVQHRTFTKHEKYISSVATVKPNDRFKEVIIKNEITFSVNIFKQIYD